MLCWFFILFLYIVYMYVFSLEIHLSRRGWFPINRFNHATSKSLPARQYDCLPIRNICVTNDYQYLQFVIITIRVWNKTKSNTTSTTSGPGMSYPSGIPEWSSCYSIFRLLCSVLQSNVCISSIFGCWFSLFYRQTFLTNV